VDAPFGTQPAVRATATDRDRRALDARLLALRLVDDLGRVSVPFGPAEVHPQQHLGPVGRLGPAGAGADGQERPALVVVAREQERGPLALEALREGLGVPLELGLELRVWLGGEEGRELLEAGRARLQVAPQLDLGAKAVRRPQDALRPALIVPESRLLGPGVESG
jgi:hypothetical protein